MVKILIYTFKLPAFKFQLHLYLYNWIKLLIVSEPSFLICTMGVIIMPTSQADRVEYNAYITFRTIPGTQRFWRFYVTSEYHPYQMLHCSENYV